MRHLGDDERRARLARRHAIASTHRVSNPLAATRAMTVLHATEPATVHLSLHARVADLTVADVDRAFYDARTLVKQLAMRRTLFVFPRGCRPRPGGAPRPGWPASNVAGQPRTPSTVGWRPTDRRGWRPGGGAVLDRLSDGSG